MAAFPLNWSINLLFANPQPPLLPLFPGPGNIAGSLFFVLASISGMAWQAHDTSKQQLGFVRSVAAPLRASSFSAVVLAFFVRLH